MTHGGERDPEGGSTAGIVLAAGASRRMPGASKLSRPWKGGTVLEAVARAARAAAIEPVVLVGGGADGAGDAAGDVHVAAPPDGGRADSLASGLAVLGPGPVVVLLGDEPGVGAGVIRALDLRCREAGADAGRVRYADRPGHPVWLGPAARVVAATLRGDAGVWERVSRPPLRAVLLEVEGPAPIDVDTPDALARARRRHGAASPPDGG